MKIPKFPPQILKNRKKMPAFSMIELIFVIVILGIIASIAIPKLSLTRSDAQFTAVNADIQSIISVAQQKAITDGASDITAENLMQTANLSPLRWVAQSEKLVLGKNSTADTKNNCLEIKIDKTKLEISVTVANSPTSPLCKKLHEAYPTTKSFALENT